MTINNIINGENIEQELFEILKDFHENGPTNPYMLEKLSYIKRFHPIVFQKYESRLMFIMGLFYKTSSV